MQQNVVKIRKRLFVLLVIIGSAIILLAARVGYWSLYKGEWLQQKAEAQWVNDEAVMPKRGSILDREKNVFAQSASSDTVVLRPENVKDANVVADALSTILELPRDEVYSKATDPDKKEIWLKRQISTEQSEQIQSMNLAGVSLISDVTRFYPNNELAAQVVGYTTVDGEGQTGIEKRYNSILEGRQGRMVSETDKNLNEIPLGQQMMIEPVDGQSVVLSIDEIMQSFLDTSCGALQTASQPQSVQGLVMDLTNGQVLAMTNMPSFNLNDPPRSDGDTLAALSRNNITAVSYEPGSIFRIFTMAAAMEGATLPAYECHGEVTIDGETILCTGNHGTQTMEQAILNGCTVAAAQQAQAMGTDVFYAAMNGFGFGQSTGIDFSTDTAGSLMAKKYAREADVADMGAGNVIQVSQIQMASAFCALVNGGTLYTPQLVLELCDSEGNTTETYEPQIRGQAVSAGTSQAVSDILMKTSGTPEGAAFTIPGYTTGSFYGAAQLYEDGAAVQGKEISTFVAYGTGSAPKYMVMMTATGVEQSETSEAVCGPYAMKVLEDILKYKNAGVDDEASRSEEKAVVPDVIGLPLDEAVSKIQEAGLTYTADGTGTVTAQMPAAEEELYTGANVSLTMETKTAQEQSEGAVDTVTVPDFSGLGFADARDLAISSGLKFVALGNGAAVGQYPAQGTVVPKGNTVSITFRLQVDSG